VQSQAKKASGMSDPQRLVFGPFELDLRDERLWCAADIIHLNPKAFAVLRCLITQAGQLVTKDGLRSWRRPPPSASVRHKSTSRSKEQGVQGLRPLFLQRLFKYILNLNKTVHSYNYLIFLLFLARY